VDQGGPQHRKQHSSRSAPYRAGFRSQTGQTFPDRALAAIRIGARAERLHKRPHDEASDDRPLNGRFSPMPLLRNRPSRCVSVGDPHPDGRIDRPLDTRRDYVVPTCAGDPGQYTGYRVLHLSSTSRSHLIATTIKAMVKTRSSCSRFATMPPMADSAGSTLTGTSKVRNVTRLHHG
jgi:hypothetical protein